MALGLSLPNAPLLKGVGDPVPPTDSNSVVFDGTGDYLTVASDANMVLGTSDFTIEFWIKFNALGTVLVLDYRPSGANGLYPAIYLSAGQLRYNTNSGDQIVGSTVTTGVWYHIALCRSGPSTKMFLDGVQQGSTYSDSHSYLCPANRPMWMENGNAPGFAVDGALSNARVIKGTALYTANFTPPTVPLTAVANTQLLIAQSSTIIDKSANAYTITAAGNAAVSTDSPFG